MRILNAMIIGRMGGGVTQKDRLHCAAIPWAEFHRIGHECRELPTDKPVPGRQRMPLTKMPGWMQETEA